MPSLFDRAAFRPQELEFFTRQLAALLAAGVPLERVLRALSGQSSRPAQQELIDRLRLSIQEGASLAQALAEHPGTFSNSYSALVDAGERSGQLGFVLGRLADSLASRNQLRSSLASALTYPIIVASVALLILVLLMAYVVPQVVGVLSAQGQDLPLLTRLLIAVSALLAQWGEAMLLLIALGMAAALFFWRRSMGVRLWVDRKLLSMPVFGRLLLLGESAQFAESLSILLRGGVPLVESLRLCEQSSSNRYLAQQLQTVRTWVQEGSELGRALEEGAAYPSLLIQMISTGEQTGELAQLLAVASGEFTRELKHRTQVITTTLEPLLILVMGLLVLGIVMAIMMPLIEMNSLVR